MTFASTSTSVRRRALAAIVGIAVAATLTVSTLAVGHRDSGDLAARKGYKGGVALTLNGGGKPVR
jgi:hypothetical protein